jgi:hypothetical protein
VGAGFQMEGSSLLLTQAMMVVCGRWRRAWVRPSPIPGLVVRMEGIPTPLSLKKGSIFTYLDWHL